MYGARHHLEALQFFRYITIQERELNISCNHNFDLLTLFTILMVDNASTEGYLMLHVLSLIYFWPLHISRDVLYVNDLHVQDLLLLGYLCVHGSVPY